MKRTALIAIMIAALAFGAVGFAIAATEDVQVTATVNPAFELTLVGDNAITLEADPLTTTTDSGASALRVRSNVPWTFTAEAPVYSDDLFATFMTDTVSIGNGAQVRGVTDIDTTYTINFNDDSAFELEPGDYTADYTYTAVQ